MDEGARDARRFFDAIAGRYDRVYAPGREASREGLAAVLALVPKGARVLDLGVGTGRELSALQDAGHEVTGLDISPRMLAQCARRTRPVPLVEADFWGPLPFPAGSFDAALALHGTLAHPPGPGAVKHLARELARILTAGSVVVMELPTLSWARRAGKGSAAGDRTEERLTFVDEATGATLEAHLRGAEAWVEDFAPWFEVSTDTGRDDEMRIVGTRVRGVE